jgi:hypothetical protein
MLLCAFMMSKLCSQWEEWSTTTGKEKEMTVSSEKQEFLFFHALICIVNMNVKNWSFEVVMDANYFFSYKVHKHFMKLAFDI